MTKYRAVELPNDRISMSLAAQFVTGERQPICGIYFLINHDEISYVGQSRNIFARVGQHLKTRKVFTDFTYIECRHDELNEFEQEMISRYKPRDNVTGLHFLDRGASPDAMLPQRPSLKASTSQPSLPSSGNPCMEPGDLLLGAPKIAEFLGVGQRQVYRMAEEGVIPVFKVGGTVSARRSSLAKWLADLEAAA